jgi:hypothetical protein
VPGDPVAEHRLHPAGEIHLRAAAGRPLEAPQALPQHVRWKVAEVVLKRVRHPASIEANVRGAVVVPELIAHHLGQQRVELAEVAEHHVATEVPGEAGAIDHRPGKAAGIVLALQDQPVGVPQPVELTRARQAARPGADDDGRL